jgi:hypothetical protein
MQRRCYEPKYKGFKNYGGRGVTVCAEWRADYRAFFRDMGRKPGPRYSLDRIDNNGNYEPSNCRWVPLEHQMRNRRGVHRITFQGETKCLTEWAESLGVGRWVMTRRLKLLPVEKALDLSVVC